MGLRDWFKGVPATGEGTGTTRYAKGVSTVSLEGDVVAKKVRAKEPKFHQTRSDVLDYLCERYHATYTREIHPKGDILLRLHLDDGDVISGRGANTGLALENLVHKIGGMP